jgi:hypothetical protein
MSSKRGQGDGNDQSGEQRPGDPGEDKVIRLPRDWLGPREDLVPFGPSADRHSPEPSESDHPSGERDAPGDSSARPPLEEVPSPPPDPVSPDDFWGERSAALQGPLDEADREAVVGDEAGPTVRRRRAPVLATAAAAVAAIAILTVSLLGQSSSGPGRSRITAGADSRGGGVDSAGGRGTLWPLPSHTRLALHRSGRSGHARPKRKKPALPQSGAAVAADYVRQAPSSRSSTASGSSGAESSSGATASSSANQSQVTFSPPTATAPTSSGATTGATTSSSTAPTSTGGTSRHKAPAFGATGALGPGHSHTG